ncbi:zinc dependent phospholipase C family protein [Romboutsia hominis]|uniref:Zinc dependent phospholipase C family protein n=1 Tax=Romboutsia faecis TaxID=2764597 RepID=A0ABR7JN97_9FIRM|nr:zinc dependent phospholipase C family protein [Romboutsia faecis]MBC5996335.1 zinc dependent phospholipase C family protein [Romboutsia faecis]
MPRAITHYLFALDCLDILDSYTKNIINENYDMYILGCQGPNFFNYYNDFSFFNNKNISQLSAIIHNKNINRFIKNMIMYSKNKENLKYVFNDINFSNICISYIYGYLTHYILDKESHPYIYNLQKNLRDKYKYKSSIALHKSIETHIDSLLLLKFKNLKPYEFKDYLNINLKNNELLILSDMYSYLVCSVYNKNVSCNDIKKSFHTFKKVENKINSSPNIISKIYLNIKNKTAKSSYIDNEVYSNYTHCINDLLNERHNKWIDPFSKQESNQSYLDIYINSLKLYIDLINDLNLYLDCKISLSSLLLKLDNKSFLTNQNCNTDNVISI